MTDWWYSYEPCEKFMRTNNQPTAVNPKPLGLTDVHTSLAELLELLNGVGLGADRADDRSLKS